MEQVHEPLLLLVVLLLLALFFALVALRWEQGRAGRASRQRNRVAQEGEAGAEELLLQAGYVIRERQASGHWSIQVSGEVHEVAVRADFLVEREGQVLVAEVKTGRNAPNPLHPATRRQLLEYARAFRPDGLLLVDMERDEILEVVFPEE